VSRLLVTGANGFIGSNLCERMLREGHRVRGLVRPTSDLRFLEGLDVEVVRGDVTDRASLAPALRDVEVVVHVAGYASDWGPFARFHAVNVGGTQNVAEVAAGAGVRRMVHVSSTAIHGFSGYRNATEDAPRPTSLFPYVETKRRAEAWVLDFAKASPLEVTAVRPGNVYGPKDHTFVEKYADALVAGKAGYVSGGATWTCPTYVENLTDALAKACFEPRASGEALIVTDGLDLDWRTFTETLADAIGAKRPRLSIPFPVGYWLGGSMEGLWRLFGSADAPLLTRYRISNGGRDYHFSIEKAKRVLGWAPAVAFPEAMRRTAAWYLSRKATAPAAGR
jgi:nucleoside-diphosphate-sugar epimerase